MCRGNSCSEAIHVRRRFMCGGNSCSEAVHVRSQIMCGGNSTKNKWRYRILPYFLNRSFTLSIGNASIVRLSFPVVVTALNIEL